VPAISAFPGGAPRAGGRVVRCIGGDAGARQYASPATDVNLTWECAGAGTSERAPVPGPGPSVGRSVGRGTVGEWFNWFDSSVFVVTPVDPVENPRRARSGAVGPVDGLRTAEGRTGDGGWTTQRCPPGAGPSVHRLAARVHSQVPAVHRCPQVVHRPVGCGTATVTASLLALCDAQTALCPQSCPHAVYELGQLTRRMHLEWSIFDAEIHGRGQISEMPDSLRYRQGGGRRAVHLWTGPVGSGCAWPRGAFVDRLAALCTLTCNPPLPTPPVDKHCGQLRERAGRARLPACPVVRAGTAGPGPTPRPERRWAGPRCVRGRGSRAGAGGGIVSRGRSA